MPQRDDIVPALKAWSTQYHALLFACRDYEDDAIQNLSHPIRDAKNLRDTLTERYAFDVERIKLLENPTRGAIIESLEREAVVIPPEDHLLIFFAGHGWWDEKRRQGYWWPTDARKKSRGDWISNDDIKDLIVGIPSRHTLLISDACFAGGLFRTRGGDPNSIKSVERLYSLPSRKAMTSGANSTVPDDSKFLHYLRDRLANNTESWLSAGSLFAALRVPVINNTDNVPQFGVIHDAGDEGGDFVFRRRAATDDFAIETTAPLAVLQPATSEDTVVALQSTPESISEGVRLADATIEENVGNVHWSFWPIAAIGLIWNLWAGVLLVFLAIKAGGFPEVEMSMQMSVLENPVYFLVFAIHCWGCAVGYMKLLLRKSVAFRILRVFLVCVSIGSIVYAMYLGFDEYDDAIYVITVMVLDALFLVWYSKLAERKGWLS